MTWVSTKWPIRTFAMTRMDTAAMFASIMSGSDMRAALGPDVGRTAFQRYDCHGSGILGNEDLVDVNYVDDDARPCPGRFNGFDPGHPLDAF
ncbi:hypothetical protein BJQ89_02929 [Arthrobacter sp. ES1]|nr:hypothetical protein [Arthrobacter sp. ES1]